MSKRTPIIGGNWKMNLDRAGAGALGRAVAGMERKGVEVVVFPPFPYLMAVGEELRKTGGTPDSPVDKGVMLGAQDVYHAEKGAFTGEVSCGMLKDCGVKVVLCGHSERRHVIGELDDLVNMKVKATLRAGLMAVLCVGETLHLREVGETNHINERQTRLGLRGVSPAEMARVVIAYEPVWAIGTGKTATPDDAQEAHAHIRAVVADMFGKAAADALRIQYGGSVNAGNARELMGMEDVDGALVGGASLKGEEFGAIVAAAGKRN